MNKITFLVLFSILAITLALPPPSWYPKNITEIVQKCFENNDITPETKLCLFTDSPKLRDYLLCKTKAMNIYSEDEGFYLDRLPYLFYYEPEKHTNDPLLKDCVNEHKNISIHEEKVYKTLRCFADAKSESKNKSEGN